MARAIVLTDSMRALLSSVGMSPATAFSTAEIMQMLPGYDARHGMERLYAMNALARERRLDPIKPGRSNRTFRYWYWRTPFGHDLLTGQIRTTTRGIKPSKANPAPVDDRRDDIVRMLDPSAMSRAAVTFRATMLSFNMIEPDQYLGMSLRQLDTFQREWTKAMKAACAAAGTPIADKSPARTHQPDDRDDPDDDDLGD